jgi:hypothetical protein
MRKTFLGLGHETSNDVCFSSGALGSYLLLLCDVLHVVLFIFHSIYWHVECCVIREESHRTLDFFSSVFITLDYYLYSINLKP